ncbi:hypothetical protein ACFYOG_25670 [Streptomyces sp. NPDC007818]|uniref:hypothetical protein n=1 Tax=Streptomyces sp. NPDC007818 TaxID=3364780 RepID=UPI0036C0B0FD
MLHFSLPMIIAIGFALLGAGLIALCAVALAWREGQTTAAAVTRGAVAFAGALTLMMLVLALLSGADG